MYTMEALTEAAEIHVRLAMYTLRSYLAIHLYIVLQPKRLLFSTFGRCTRPHDTARRLRMINI